jgi:BASS family bile acid:Na+ symporter
MIQRFLLLWLFLSSAAALYWPRLGISASWFPDWIPAAGRQWLADPWFHSRGSLDAAVMVTMFAIGMMLPRDEVRQILRRWPTVLGGTTLQYSAMPLLAFFAGRLFGLEGSDLIGVTLVGCVPGAMASNVLTLNAGGNTSYSVSLTTSATLLSPLVVPLVLALVLSGSDQVNSEVLQAASLKLLWRVVLPVLLGHGLARGVVQVEILARRWGPLIANLAILWIIAVVVALNRESLFRFNGALAGILLLMNLLGYLAGYLGGWAMRLPEPMRRALTLEVGMQNAGLGSMLAVSLFAGVSDDEVAVAPAMYMFGCMATGTVLSAFWARYLPPTKKKAVKEDENVPAAQRVDRPV